MLTKTIARVALSAGLILAFSACSDDEGSDELASGTHFPASMAETFGSTGVTLADFASSAVDFGGTNVAFAAPLTSADNPRSPQAVIARLMTLTLAPQGATFSPAFLSSPTCNPTVTGSGTDTDADGIPDDMLVEYTAANCTVTDTATGDIQVNRGTLRYRDTSGDLYGFDLTVTELRYSSYDGSTHDWTDQTVNVHETAKTTSSGGNWSLLLDADLKGGSADTVQIDQKVKYDVKGTYTSNGAVPAGGPIPDGTISLSGSLDATLPQAGRLDMHLVTTTALHFESSCTSVDSGKLELRLNGNAAEGVLVRWLSCTERNFEFLGSGVL